MKLRDLERHLLDSGARRVGEGANHTKWRGPAGAPSVVPRHREVDFRLVRKICRDRTARARSLSFGTQCQNPAYPSKSKRI